MQDGFLPNFDMSQKNKEAQLSEYMGLILHYELVTRKSKLIEYR